MPKAIDAFAGMVRRLALALLTNDNYISQSSYDVLLEMMDTVGGCEDITDAVEATDGEFYLPASFDAKD